MSTWWSRNDYAKEQTLSTAVGAAGDTPPTLPPNARGVLGWLRLIVDKLSSALHVVVDSLPEVEVKNDAGSPLSVESAIANQALGTPADASSTSGDGTIVALLKRLRTLLNGGLPAALSSGGGVKTGIVDALPAGTNAIGTVDLSGATPTTIADAATVAAPKYIGVSVANTSLTASAQIRVRDNNVSGTMLDTITLAPNESVSYTYPRGRAVASGTVYIQVASGAAEGSIFTT